MISLELREGVLRGVPRFDLEKDFPEFDLIRQIERYAIQQYMASCAPLLRGDVLDFGSGKQPYRRFVSGNYFPFEKGDIFPAQRFDAIICNQVFQYISDPIDLLMDFYTHLKVGGHLIMTIGTNWPEVEEDDIVRYTRTGIRKLLIQTGFSVLKCETRADLVIFGHFKLSTGCNILARRDSEMMP